MVSEEEKRRRGERPSDRASAGSADVTAGAVIASKYRIDGVLGSGGMGVVFAATHLQLGEPFAIKLLHPEISARQDALGRFLREARIAMRLRGEHVVRIFEVGTLDGGPPFIAMERLEGSDLRAVLLQEGRIAPPVAVAYVLQACEAIAEAHAQGVIHRDLKPANLFLTTRVDGSPCVKVLDFGISKIGLGFGLPGARLSPSASSRMPSEASEVSLELADTAPASGTGVTRTRSLLGSPRYMAPEQLRSPRDVDVRADVWALGAILFELLAGKPPFDGNSLDEIRRAVTGVPAPPLPDIPPELEWIAHRCLAKEPRQRFGSVCDLATALAPFASEEGAEIASRIAKLSRGARAVDPKIGPPPVPPAADSDGLTEDAVVDNAGRRPNRTASAALTGAAVAAIAAGAFLALARGRAPSRSYHDDASGTGQTPSASAMGEVTDEPATSPVSVESAQQAPSSTAIARAPSPPRKAPPLAGRLGRPAASAEARDPADPVASAPATALAASGSAVLDPLRIDAGALFNERK